jgi:WD40 repeat protein
MPTSQEEIMFSGLANREIIPIFVFKSNYEMSEIFWHPTDPMVFFTCGRTTITSHQIQKDYRDSDTEENKSIVIGEIEIGECFSSICISQNGILMLVLIPEMMHAKLFRLGYEDGEIQFFRLRDQTIFGNAPITEFDFLGDDIIAFISNDEEETISIRKICPKSGKVKHEVFGFENLETYISCKFSPDGKLLAILSFEALTLYSFSKESLKLTFIQSIPLRNKYIGLNFQWHPTLPLLIFLSQKGKINFVEFYKVGKDGLTTIYQVDILANLHLNFLINNVNVIFGYYSSDITKMRLTIDFEDLVRFPIEHMLCMRKALTDNLPIDEVVEVILRNLYNDLYKDHLSFERCAHLIQP